MKTKNYFSNFWSQYKIWLGVAIFFLAFEINAQNLTVTLIDNTMQSFAISEISSIKFESGTMILRETNGTTTSWSTPSISDYSFGALNVNDHLFVEKSNLNLYPNPSTALVNIKYNTNSNTTITIDIFDVNGRLIEQLFKGNHSGEHIYQWHSKANKGVYFCRISSDSKVISKPIIIQ